MTLWRNYLPEPETQIIAGVDSMQCTAHATIDAIQILLGYKYQDFTEYEESFTSFLAKTSNEGNNPRWVAQIIKQYGLYPRGALSHENRISEKGDRAIAKHFTRNYEFDFKEIKQENFAKELATSPIGVALHAWVEEEEGIYGDVGVTPNHWTLIVDEDMDYYYCWDSIEPNLKRLRKPFKFVYLLRYAVQRRRNMWWYDILNAIRNK